jgi:hypothetical protein
VYYGYIALGGLIAVAALSALLVLGVFVYQRLTPDKKRRDVDRIDPDSFWAVSTLMVVIAALAVYGVYWGATRIDNVIVEDDRTVVLRGLFNQELGRIAPGEPRELSRELSSSTRHAYVSEKVFVTSGGRTYGTFAVSQDEAYALRELLSDAPSGSTP